MNYKQLGLFFFLLPSMSFAGKKGQQQKQRRLPTQRVLAQRMKDLLVKQVNDSTDLSRKLASKTLDLGVILYVINDAIAQHLKRVENDATVRVEEKAAWQMISTGTPSPLQERIFVAVCKEYPHLIQARNEFYRATE